jgi:hypothetical protein
MLIDRWPWPARALARREQRLYQRIHPADLVLVLRVDPRTAVARRPEQDEQFVRRRNAEIWTHEWVDPRVVVLDASRPADQVRRDALDTIWRKL